MKTIRHTTRIVLLFLACALCSCNRQELFASKDFPFVMITSVESGIDGELFLEGALGNIGSNLIMDHGFIISEGEIQVDDIESQRGFLSLGKSLAEGSFSLSAKISLTPGVIHYIYAYARTPTQVVLSEFTEFVTSFSPQVKILDFIPKSGSPGDEVKIIGEFFNLDPARNDVSFGTSTAQAHSATKDTLYVWVPYLEDGDYAIIVGTGKKVSQSTSTFHSEYNITVSKDGLKLYYDFNSNVADLSGNEVNSFVNGPQNFVTDKNGKENSSMSFNGFTNYISTSTTFDFQERTVSIWIYPQQVESSDIQVILTQDDNNLNYGILRIDIQSGTLKLWSSGTDGTYSLQIQNNQWYHLVLIRTVSATKYYINNSLKFTSFPDEFRSTFNPKPYLVIGAGRTFQQNYSGIIDELLIYDRELSPQEIAELYNF